MAASRYTDLHVGVLAVQGDFERHQHQLFSLGADVTLVRLPVELEKIDGLIIPGGESTTMDALLDRFGLRQPLLDFGRGRPIWGTCAGMIMLSKSIVDNKARVKPLGLMDIDVVRTGYGRQVFSFQAAVTAHLDNRTADLRATFIRAPKIVRMGENVRSIGVYQEDPVLVAERNFLASSFHTELDEDTTLLEYFLDEFILARSES